MPLRLPIIRSCWAWVSSTFRVGGAWLASAPLRMHELHRCSEGILWCWWWGARRLSACRPCPSWVFSVGKSYALAQATRFSLPRRMTERRQGHRPRDHRQKEFWGGASPRQAHSMPTGPLPPLGNFRSARARATARIWHRTPMSKEVGCTHFVHGRHRRRCLADHLRVRPR